MADPARKARAPTRSLAVLWPLPVRDLKVLTRKEKVLEREPGRGTGCVTVCQSQSPGCCLRDGEDLLPERAASEDLSILGARGEPGLAQGEVFGAAASLTPPPSRLLHSVPLFFLCSPRPLPRGGDGRGVVLGTGLCPPCPPPRAPQRSGPRPPPVLARPWGPAESVRA